MKTIWKLEEEVTAYCKRHGIELKSFRRINRDLSIEAESFDFTWLEARISDKGRTVFKVKNKVTSLYK